MTTIIKRPDSPYYYARFKVNGKDIWISTKTKDPREARRFANTKRMLARGEASIDDLFTNLQTMLADLPQDKQDSKRQELSRRIVQGKAVSLPVSETWQAWLNSPLKGNPSERTIQATARFGNGLATGLPGIKSNSYMR